MAPKEKDTKKKSARLIEKGLKNEVSSLTAKKTQANKLAFERPFTVEQAHQS